VTVKLQVYDIRHIDLPKQEEAVLVRHLLWEQGCDVSDVNRHVINRKFLAINVKFLIINKKFKDGVTSVPSHQ
jgi:hypothetical protein